MNSLRVILEGTDAAVMEAIRVFLSSGGGVVSAVSSVTSAAPSALPPLPSPSEQIIVRDKREKPARPTKVASTAPATCAVTPATCTVTPSGEYTGWKASIIAQLGKKPMTTGELLASLKPPTSGAVYDACFQLRKAGVIKTRLDESDGQRKNFLAEAK